VSLGGPGEGPAVRFTGGADGVRRESGAPMTSTKESHTIEEVLAMIDRGLNEMQRRELVSTDEVADLLLDVRVLLAACKQDEVVAN
jgi:hypothetical protein